MRNFFGLFFLCRAYVIAALAAGAIFSPLVYAPIPWLLLLVYLYLTFRPARAHLMIAMNVFLALCLPLFFQPLVGVWASPVFALPVIPPLNYSLRQSALSQDISSTKEGRRPTPLCLRLLFSLAAVGLVALALASWALLLTCGVLAGYLGTVIGIVLHRGSKPLIEVEVKSYRVVAGNPTQVPLSLVNQSRLAAQVTLISPYSWLHIRPSRLLLDKPAVEVGLSFVPPLAGPATLVAQTIFEDPWGLVQWHFKLDLLHLFVIPRARYAEWLARRYLETSRAGSQEAAATTAPGSQRPSRKGMEFYGLRAYQPGDSARIIDWKHSLRLHQTIVKEFLDTGVEGAVLAVNLSVSDEEEKDKLAYSLITTALTLARESIPSALAAYNQEAVVTTTRFLDPKRVLLQVLGLAREVMVSLPPLRYLSVPDVERMRGNIYRLRCSQREPAVRLAELLDLEYEALSKSAAGNPASKALAASLAEVRRRVNVVILSGHNHDAEALALQQYSLRQRGHRVLQVELGQGRPHNGPTTGSSVGNVA
jgi:uncharacterized protein (DUF58 family)